MSIIRYLCVRWQIQLALYGGDYLVVTENTLVGQEAEVFSEETAQHSATRLFIVIKIGRDDTMVLRRLPVLLVTKWVTPRASGTSFHCVFVVPVFCRTLQKRMLKPHFKLPHPHAWARARRQLGSL